MKPTIAAKSTTMTGPNSIKYTLQKRVIPIGTSRYAGKNKATVSQVRIRTDVTARLLLGFAIMSAGVLMEPNLQLSHRRLVA
jgi:hypothetical protein